MGLYYYDVTMKTFRFVTAHLTASNKAKLANQNAAYKITSLEWIITIVPAVRISRSVVFHVKGARTSADVCPNS